jgi:hypothetical protein
VSVDEEHGESGQGDAEHTKKKHKTVGDEEKATRKCARLQGRQGKIQEIAIARAEKKDSEGTNIKTENPFSVLDDDEIVSRVLQMGVNIGDNKLEKVNFLKHLEKSRHALDKKKVALAEEGGCNTNLAPDVVYLGWKGEGSDGEVSTPVVSKKRVRKKWWLIVIKRESPGILTNS